MSYSSIISKFYSKSSVTGFSNQVSLKIFFSFEQIMLSVASKKFAYVCFCEN